MDNSELKNSLEVRAKDVLLMYKDESNYPYKVIVNQNKGVKLVKGGIIPRDFLERSEIVYSLIKEFNSPEAFWTDFTKDLFWFKTYTPFFDNETRKPTNNYFAFKMLHQANKIRNSLEIEWTNYTAIIKWEAAFEMYKIAPYQQLQVCSNCMTKVRFYPRYPTAICRTCMQKITDKNGRKIFYYLDPNTSRYKGKYENQEPYNNEICYIGDKEFFVTEARMSGMVIQLLSAKDYMI